MDMAAATASEWRYWVEREDATLRVQTAVGVYDHHPLVATGGAVKRRAPTWREQAASAGAYTARNLVFLIPDANLPGGIAPAAGDQVLDAAGIEHTILEVVLGKFGNTHRCTTIALAVVNDLRELGTLSRPTNAQDASGRQSLATYATVGTSYCRVQPEDSAAAEVLGRRTTARRYTAYLATPLVPRAKDRFVAGGVTYTVLGFRQPERLDQLLALDLEVVA